MHFYGIRFESRPRKPVLWYTIERKSSSPVEETREIPSAIVRSMNRIKIKKLHTFVRRESLEKLLQIMEITMKGKMLIRKINNTFLKGD